jgi:hypothetical protein
MEDVGIFYGRLFYFTAIWYILWSFGIFYVFFVYFPPFWYVRYSKKNLATLLRGTKRERFPRREKVAFANNLRRVFGRDKQTITQTKAACEQRW